MGESVFRLHVYAMYNRMYYILFFYSFFFSWYSVIIVRNNHHNQLIWPYITLHVMFLLGLLRMIFVLQQTLRVIRFDFSLLF